MNGSIHKISSNAANGPLPAVAFRYFVTYQHTGRKRRLL